LEIIALAIAFVVEWACQAPQDLATEG
jgi:hypothetical protein